MTKKELRQLMTRAFNLAELRILCFDLEIEYEGLRGEIISEKIISLISFCERNNTLEVLQQYVQQESSLMNSSQVESNQLNSEIINSLKHFLTREKFSIKKFRMQLWKSQINSIRQ
ncbi:MAG: hypothetical protein KDD45_01035 [Bdellovibrionales bacterium]|nr:hypothetical protein [Bdellovibrionales bacterium]